MKIFLFALCAVAIIALTAIIIKLLSSAVVFISGAFNTILALLVIAALIIIVFWMFSYAKRMR